MAEDVTYDDRGEVSAIPTNTVSPGFDWSAYQKQQNQIASIQQANDQRTQDDAYLKNLVQNRKIEEAQKAVEFAMQFQGMRGFERDLQSAKLGGLSDEQAATQALIRNAPKMFYKHPRDFAYSMQSLRAPFVPQVSSTPQGTMIRSGRYGERVQIVPPEKPPQARITLQPADPLQGRMKPSYSVSGPPSAVTPYAEKMGITNLTENPSAPVQNANKILPLPKSKTELVKDAVYSTSKGNLRWNGNRFVGQ